MYCPKHILDRLKIRAAENKRTLGKEIEMMMDQLEKSSPSEPQDQTSESPS
jgi:hypothetical protein